MSDDQYTLELKTRGLNEEEQGELLNRIDEEFGVEFEEDEQIEELHDPATIRDVYRDFICFTCIEETLC